MTKKTFLILWLLWGVSIVAAQTPPDNENSMRMVLDEKKISVYSRGQILFSYLYGDVPYKPYVRELYTPTGANILRDAPHDHLHHHGLMFAYSIDGINFWEELPACGKELHTQFDEFKIAKEAKTKARFTENIDWMEPAKKEVLLKEQRTIEAEVLPESKTTLLTWTGVFSLPPGKSQAVIGGKHYNGLGMRFLESMDQDETAKFFNTDGKDETVFRGEEKLVRSSWCAFTSHAEGKPVTVAMFDFPDNTRHPATWFTMKKPFAYLSATLAVHEEPMVLRGSEKLILCYGVAVWDGATGPEEIEKVYQAWIKAKSQKKEDANSQGDKL
jgi:hypothetical protein